MKIKKVALCFRIVDFLLVPFMWFLGKFTFPLQETHPWHVQTFLPKLGYKRLMVKSKKTNLRFGHESRFGLYHMPIFGGLNKYAVLEAHGFNNYWHIGWIGTNKSQIQKLPIRQSRIKLLRPKNGYFEAVAFDEYGRNIKLKLVGNGRIGDRKYPGIRLF